MTRRSGPSARRALVPVGAAFALAASALIPTVWSSSAAAATTPVTVLYKTSTPAVNDEVDPWFELVNNTSSAIPYSSLTIDYYFADPSDETYDFECAWAVVSCADLTGTVLPAAQPVTGADHILQITFSAAAGSLAPGANSGDMQLRMWRADWANINQANDYSFNASDTSYTAWDQVTAFESGTLVWGTEPNGTTANPSPPATGTGTGTTGTGTGTGSPSPTGTGTGTTSPSTGVMFDDFDYTSSSDPNLAAHDWTPRTAAGGPGVSGATWSASAITFPASTAAGGTHVMDLSATTDGTGADTVQSEMDTTSQKFFEGTYAARVYFNDTPTSGPNGDCVNETFYSISPDNSLYSEDDFEYLPNGGWGGPDYSMYTTSWYSADDMERVTNDTEGSLQGWHTLVETVLNGTVTYYIDGTQVFSSTGEYYPREDMTIDFNEWFIDGETASSSTARTWNELVGWVYYAGGQSLSTTQVEANVAGYQTAGTSFKDTVPAP